MGVDVAKWQAFLCDQGYCNAAGLPVSISGEFDNDTEHATIRFQQDLGLERTGMLCANTEARARLLGWRR